MKKSLILVFVAIGSPSIASESGFPHGSILSNPSFEKRLGLPLFGSSESLDSFGKKPDAFAVALSAQASSDKVQVYPAGKDGYMDEQAAIDIHKAWIASLPEKALQEKCALIEQERTDKGYIGVVGTELLDEFHRRYPEGSSVVFAGLKGRGNFARADCDAFYESSGAKNLETCVARVVARNDAIEHELLVTVPSKDKFAALVAEQVEIARALKMLEFKKQRDEEDGLCARVSPVEGFSPGNLHIPSFFPQAPRKKVRSSAQLK